MLPLKPSLHLPFSDISLYLYRFGDAEGESTTEPVGVQSWAYQAFTTTPGGRRHIMIGKHEEEREALIHRAGSTGVRYKTYSLQLYVQDNTRYRRYNISDSE